MSSLDIFAMTPLGFVLFYFNFLKYVYSATMIQFRIITGFEKKKASFSVL